LGRSIEEVQGLIRSDPSSGKPTVEAVIKIQDCTYKSWTIGYCPVVYEASKNKQSLYTPNNEILTEILQGSAYTKIETLNKNTRIQRLEMVDAVHCLDPVPEGSIGPIGELICLVTETPSVNGSVWVGEAWFEFRRNIIHLQTTLPLTISDERILRKITTETIKQEAKELLEKRSATDPKAISLYLRNELIAYAEKIKRQV
jgi:hypothetical protein